MKLPDIGILSMGMYMPEEIMDSRSLGAASGIPEEVIREKFGIKKIHKAGNKESVTEMAVKAARKALGGMDPEELDLVVYCGSEYKDYYLYNCAAAIQYELGAVKANAFEIHSLCSAGAYSLKVLKSMMQADERLNKVLLVTASKESQLLDYQNQRSRFMFNFGDGAAAVVLKRGHDRNHILETHMITRGDFSSDVAVFDIGCRNYPPQREKGGLFPYYLDVPDLKGMKERLNPVTLDNFISVIEESLLRSGYGRYDVDFLAPIFMKRSILQNILDYFRLSEEDSFVLEEYGHCQSADAFISLIEGAERSRIEDGHLAVLFGAGTGYTWAATAVRWGRKEKISSLKGDTECA